jgi:hypothetical protein
MTCNCGNPEFGFDCVCDWVKDHPGNIEYCCEFCGMYTAGKPRCNKCEAENPEKGTIILNFPLLSL